MTALATERRPAVGEATPAQVVSFIMEMDQLPSSRPPGVTYATYRALRTDPTIALARGLLCAAVLAGEWSVEADDDVEDDVRAFLQDLFPTRREQIMEPAVYGSIDYGWQGFEKVFIEKDGRLTLTKLKPLLPDLTLIQIEKQTGAFAGYKQRHAVTGQDIILPVEKCLHLGFRVEGTQWHGQALMENARAAQAKWEAANTGAAAYDKKIAGSHFVVYYPPGISKVAGVEKDNGEVAALLLTALEGSGSITVPRTIAEFMDQLSTAALADSFAWKIELLEDRGGRQPTFVDRLKYLDALKVRALLLPERAILEGEFGTKAEAGVHADMALTNIQLLDRYITRHVNWYVVDQLLALNWGEDMRGKARLVASPLIDEQITFLREAYKLVLTNPQGFIEEFGTIDTDALKDKLGLPKAMEVAPAGSSTGELEEETEPPLPGLTPEQRAALSHFTPRVEDGKWTFDGSGLTRKFGVGFEDVDDGFAQSRQLANEGKLHEARGRLYSLRRVDEPKIMRAINHRIIQMLERFLRMEQRQVFRI